MLTPKCMCESVNPEGGTWEISSELSSHFSCHARRLRCTSARVIREAQEARAIFEKARSRENLEICDQAQTSD